MTDAANPERLLFASTTQSFLEKEASLSRLRELHDAGTSFETDWWRRAAELGWTSLLVPEELGGGSVSGDGVADLALVAELAAGPSHQVRCIRSAPCWPVWSKRPKTTSRQSNPWSRVRSWLRGRSTNRANSGHRCDAAVTATRTETGYRIDGVKDRVEAGAESAVLLVVAHCDGAVRQFLVPTDASGVSVESQRSIDMVKTLCPSAFRRCRGRRLRGRRLGRADPGDHRAAEPDRRDSPVRRDRRASWRRCSTSPSSGGSTGIRSAGRIGSYQALKHKYADLKIWFEACRATTNAAVAEVAVRSPGAEMSVSVAKSYVGEHAPGMLQDCIQLHGGIGVTWEHDLHLFLRRVTLYRSMFGTPEDHNLRVYALTKNLEHAS